MNMAEKPPVRGLQGVVAADSAIGNIDGERGELRYCGYLIKDLADGASFVETTYLLWHGELPARAELAALDAELRRERDLPPQVMEVLRAIAKRQRPMDALRTAISALSVEDDGKDVTDRARTLRRAKRLVACTPSVVAAYERLRRDQPPVAPRGDLDHAANFLYMLTGREPQAETARILDVCLVLHAEHDLNASTFAARVTAATLADLYAAVTSAIGTLSGPLHGGANTAVMQNLIAIGEEDRVEPWLDAVLGGGEKVMGFGHRVYKVTDPRALILKSFSRRLGELTGQPKWFRMSERLEGLVKARKGIDVNVDFYSASVYYAMGIEPDLFTCLFAMARMSGWTAHVLEQYANNRLIRPRSNWIGAPARAYVPIDRRG